MEETRVVSVRSASSSALVQAQVAYSGGIMDLEGEFPPFGAWYSIRPVIRIVSFVSHQAPVIRNALGGILHGVKYMSCNYP